MRELQEAKTDKNPATGKNGVAFLSEAGMKRTIRDRREQIRRDFDQLKSLGWTNIDIFEELGNRYFLSADTIRQNVYCFGGYADESGKGTKQ